MLVIKVQDELEKRLEALSSNTGQSKSYVVQEALQEYLDEREDVHIALSRLKDDTDEIISLDEMRKHIGLES